MSHLTIRLFYFEIFKTLDLQFMSSMAKKAVISYDFFST